MKILFIGDIVGRPGRYSVKQLLPKLRKQHNINFTIANGENAAGGFGITAKVTAELLEYGVDVITMGNHVWANKEVPQILTEESRLLRPANYPEGVPGQGVGIYSASDHTKIAVINLCGRTFMNFLDCPFQRVEKELEKIKPRASVTVIDFHAEATSEKLSMGWFLDGKVTAVIGTHTHVQTADEQILPQGTAYITDIGMAGPLDSILGIKKDLIINRFITQMPVKFEVARGATILGACIIEVDSSNGKAQNIVRLQEYLSKEQ